MEWTFTYDLAEKAELFILDWKIILRSLFVNNSVSIEHLLWCLSLITETYFIASYYEKIILKCYFEKKITLSPI